MEQIYESRQFMIFNLSELNNIDFSQFELREEEYTS